MANVFIGGRQSGKTAMLIKRSAITGETIAVATHEMAKYVKNEAYRLGLDIPQPVTYADIFQNYYEHPEKNIYLVDELQMLLHRLNINASTLDESAVCYLKGEEIYD